MKKILMVIAAVAVLQTVAYAQNVDFSGDVTGGKSVEVTNLENGYYDLTAVCKNTSEEGVSYLYGVSDGYTAASTVLPVSADGVKVTVRGIEVENGKCTIGVGTDGNGVIEVSDVDFVKTDKQNGFIQGGDMTEVDYIESLGGEYKDSDGNKVDPFEFLSQNGMNMARIRLSNTPGKGKGDGVYYLPSGFQDEDIVPIYNVELAIKTDKKINKVYLAPQKEDIDFTYENGYISVKLDKIECHQMVVFE